MNKHYIDKIENFYSRDLNKIKEQLDTYYTLCLRFNALVGAINKTGFYHSDQNNVFDIVELFVAHCLKEHGINLEHIVDRIIVEDNNE